MSGCAMLPGLQSYDIPESGVYETDQGSKVNVVPLNNQTIKSISATTDTTGSEDIAALFAYRPNTYHLTSGDTLKLSFWYYPELSPLSPTSDTGYRIDQAGKLNLPLVGTYQAKGKTLSQVRTELRKLYSNYLRQPDLNIEVIAYQGFGYTIQGQVAKAGQFYFNDKPINFYTALGEAGGLTPLGSLTSIDLYRSGRVYNINSLNLEDRGLSLQQLYLKPNDTIFINAKDDQKIYVMGESGKNQALTIRDRGMTLADVLGESQGISPTTASATRIYVLRSSPQHDLNMYHLDLLQIGNFALANNFAMQKNDIIYIDSTGLARWQRIVNQILPFSAGLNNVQRLGL